jgi:NAD(P)-dependent dehydrogenase (short-subunit alcohol dehydrogenase family)
MSQFVRELFDIEGRIAAVTGGGGHLCGEMARALASAGCHVAVLDLQINNACNGVTLSDIDRQKLYRLRHEPASSQAEEKEVVAA